MRFRLSPLLLLLVGLAPGCPQFADDDFVKVDAPDEATGASRGDFGTVHDVSISSGNATGGAAATDATSAAEPTETIGTSLGGSGSASATVSDTTGMHAGGSTSSSGGVGTGGVGAGGSGGPDGGTNAGDEVLGCSDKRTPTQPFLTDFEAYDGQTPPLEFRFPFSASGGAISTELVNYGDESGDYTLSFVAGAQGSSYAVNAKNPAASNWGGGVSLRIHCIDASAFRGIEFMARGTTPATTVEVALVIDENDWFIYLFEIEPDWQPYAIEFSQFRSRTGGPSVTTTGDGITYIVWNSQLDYREVSTGTWEAQAGAFEIAVDDVRFLE